MDPLSSSGDELFSTELWWRDHQPWLQEKGYVLRPRYTPGWTPSWKGKEGIVFSSDYEDGQVSMNAQIMDAVGPEDVRVCLKMISLRKDSQEPITMDFLSSPTLRQNPANHCIPLIDQLRVPDDDNMVLLVLPLFRTWTSPPMETVGEAMEFIRQLFEGVEFMHQQGVAHRDIKYNNVMMDASELYPEGFHFVQQDRTPDFSRLARHFSRTEKPPKYYLIDFGHAKQYDLSKGPPSDMPMLGGDKSVPEHQPEKRDQPCDPFKVDVYCTGNILRTYFTEGLVDGETILVHAKKDFDFIKPLVADMVQDDPSKRPTMAEAMERFAGIKNSLSGWRLRSRLAEKRESMLQGLFWNVQHWGRTAGFIARQLPAMPMPQPK